MQQPSEPQHLHCTQLPRIRSHFNFGQALLHGEARHLQMPMLSQHFPGHMRHFPKILKQHVAGHVINAMQMLLIFRQAAVHCRVQLVQKLQQVVHALQHLKPMEQAVLQRLQSELQSGPQPTPQQPVPERTQQPPPQHPAPQPSPQQPSGVMH